MAINNGPNHLHGGPTGYNTRVFSVEATHPDADKDDAISLVLKTVSPDGDEGYPGELSFWLIYTLTPSNQLVIRYRAATDAPTIVNLTNHSYWNLKGHDSGPVLDHVVRLNSDAYTARDRTGIPTGSFTQVSDDKAYDFRTPRAIGSDQSGPFQQVSRQFL